MAQERPNRLVELMAIVRQGLPVAREQAREWLVQARANPAAIWDMAVVRYIAYGLLGLLVTWSLTFVVRLISPPAPAGAREPARTADFRVVCSDPACGYSFVLRREFGFDAFPVPCDRCKKQSGVQGRRCFSNQCQGRWVAPITINGGLACSKCGGGFSVIRD